MRMKGCGENEIGVDFLKRSYWAVQQFFSYCLYILIALRVETEI